MSTPAKIVLVIVGLLFIAIAGVIAGLVFVGHSLMPDTNDPATERRIAAKLGSFSVPSGYHISHALDFISHEEVELSPDDAGSSFKIKLTAGLANDPSTQAEGVDIGLRLVAGVAKCDFAPQPDDVVVVARVVTTLHVRACPRGALPMRVETGMLPNGISLLALGIGKDFDGPGLHALLRSFK